MKSNLKIKIIFHENVTFYFSKKTNEIGADNMRNKKTVGGNCDK